MLQVNILPTTDKSLDKVLLDPEDEWIMRAASWHITADGYVGGRINRRYVLLQHVVIEPPPVGYLADHINQIKHDYRKDNLRYATPTGNRINSPAFVQNGIRELPSGRFNGRVMFRGSRVGVGTYDTREEAEAAIIAHLETLDVASEYLAHDGQNSRDMELLKASRLQHL